MKYRLNVSPGIDHELTDNEVTDLKAMGFEVTPLGSEDDDKNADEGTKAPAKSTEKKGA